MKPETVKDILKALRIGVLLAVSTCPLAFAQEAHLVRIDGGFRTTHGLPYTITSERMTAAGPTHRSDRFGENPYEISLAAFISEDGVVMIHAERVVNKSGASNYEDKPVSDWPDDSFRSDGAVCFDVPASEVEGEHDLEWLRDNGFDPSGTLIFAQYFASTPDFNDEIVISLLSRENSCDAVTDPNALLAPLKGAVTISSGTGG